MRAWVLLVVLLLLVIPAVSARDIAPPTLVSGGEFADPGNAALCKVPTERGHISDYFYVYADQPDSCAQFRSGDDFMTIRGDTSSTYGIASGQTTRITDSKATPVLRWAAESFDSKMFGRTDKHREFSSTLGRIVDLPASGEVELLTARMCAERMEVTFGTTTGVPDGLYTEFNVDTDNSAYSKCGSNLDDALWQGYIRRSTAQEIYELPLFCSRVGIRVTDLENEDWDFAKGTHWYREEDQGTIQKADNDNVFRFDVDYTNGVLRSFTVALDDSSGEAGGFVYTVLCDDPIEPDESADVCTSISGQWDDQMNCCYEETDGELRTDADGTDHVCSYQPTGYSWVENTPVACENTEGDKLPSDPESYCCSEETTEKPHLWQHEGTEPQDAYPYYCTDQGLQSNDHQDPYAYAEGQWWECTEETLGDDHGQYLCNDASGSYEWEVCNCGEDATDPNCGESETTEGMYCAEPNLEGASGRWTTNDRAEGACLEKQKINGQCCWEGDAPWVELHEQDAATAWACIDGKVLNNHPQPDRTWPFSNPGPLMQLLVKGGLS